MTHAHTPHPQAPKAAEPKPKSVLKAVPSDLGFGSVVVEESRRRLLNPDGSFNVVREGLNPLTSLSLYHSLLTLTWTRFLALIIGFYLTINTIFAFAFMACGPQALVGVTATDGPSPFWRSFFFSVQTFATIGYGHLSPSGMPANLLVTVESLVGLLGFALATGLLFARFSRPTAKILFSLKALIAPYQGLTAFELRIANARSNQLTEVHARIMLSKLPNGKKTGNREFWQLSLERDDVAFFPLSWTIVHPIDEASPLWGMTEETLAASGAEFYVLLSAYDETFAQTVRARTSYKPDEIVWGANFKALFNSPRTDGLLSINIGRLNEYEWRDKNSNQQPKRAEVAEAERGESETEGEELAS